MKTCVDGGVEHRNCEEFMDENENFLVVCHDCRQTLGRKTEVWARPCGYLRPTDGFNNGKKAEFKARRTYNIGI